MQLKRFSKSCNLLLKGENILKLVKKIFGTHSTREIKKIKPVLNKIMSLENEYSKLSDKELQGMTSKLRERLNQGETLDDILPEAFATVREAAWRTIGLKPYEVQVLGGIILHQGRIAEMKTGEGKTLVATMPTYLNALTGKGVFVVTVNDYLAKRDSEQMGKVYNYLGLTTGLVVPNMSLDDRRAAYGCDITYCTNNEVGFDYLKDNMVPKAEYKTQRGFNYAIVDEIDSILIDEARTPLIISGPGDDLSTKYEAADKFVRGLKGREAEEEKTKLEKLLEKDENDIYADFDYVVDHKMKTVALTERGVRKAEKYYKVKNLGDLDNIEVNHYISIALKAHYLFKKDVDYVVNNGSVDIIDEHTGRLMDGRRYSEGLHQAIETKEGVTVQKESRTLATISFQNLFRRFKKLSGMTGTAMTEEEEFRSIYGLDVVEIPTNKPVIREDSNDKVYLTEQAKLDSIVNTVKECNDKGQPIIIGTSSVESSEKFSKLLKQNGIKHQVLNAKYHEMEAEIIAQAGEYKTVTIATNMAGRGTDIILGGNVDFKTKQRLTQLGYSKELIEESTTHTETNDKNVIDVRKKYKEIFDEVKKEIEPQAEIVRSLGGLYILGTERHPSRRIDNQLRGRSGRQGDPGKSEFVISLEDDLLRLFGTSKLKDIVANLNMPTDVPIDARIMSNSIEKAQRRIESIHYQSRKTLLEYDSVLELQREIIYTQRNEVLDKENVGENILAMVQALIEDTVKSSIVNKDITINDQERIRLEFSEIKGLQSLPEFSEDELTHINAEEIIDKITEEFINKYNELKEVIKNDVMQDYEKRLLLFQVDFHWQEHIDMMDELKLGAGLRSIGEQDPVMVYKDEAFEMFKFMTNRISHEVFKSIMNAHTQYVQK